MNLLQLLGSAEDGGAETYFLALVQAMAGAGVRQACAIRAHAGRQARLQALGVPVEVMPFGGPLDLITRGRVARLAKARGATALIAWMNRAARFAPRGPWARIGRLGGYYGLKYYRGFDALVANTRDIEAWIVRQGWPANRVRYIPNFAEPGSEPALARATLDTPDGVPLLLAMGRLHESKAHDISLKALARLPDAWLWIAGSGPLESELKALAEQLGVAGRVRFLGWRDDASALYRTADICLFPSRFEPLGNVVIQAWAHGLPIVAAASQGPSDLIVDGEDGLLVPVDDDETLARAARGLIGEAGLAERLAQAGAERVAREFSQARVLAEWQALLALGGSSVMCGVAGVVGGGSEAEVQAMIETIAHRGPDGIRTELILRPGKNQPGVVAALAHARLSIIDLEGGWQPLHAAGCTVIGNGEIYNYRELIDQFGLKGELATGSDFEPLLHIYAREGERAFDRLRGMYALCLVGPDGRVWLARDPFGIKPLYYHQTGGTLSFASEPRALLGDGKRQIEAQPLDDLLALNYATGRDTPFKGVRRMKPGEVAEVIYGRLAPRRIRPAIPRPVPGSKPPRNEAEAIEALDKVLEDSVRVHQRSDVPYGLFLSGGIDSAAIATMMARLNERPVTAFTCSFAGQGGVRDERAQAEAVARSLNLDWREVSFGEEDFWRVLPAVANALDEPTSDYAVLPTYKLAEAAKGTLTVVLTGEGGDELFAGYGRYRRALRSPLFGGRPADPRADTPFLRDHGQAAVQRWRQATDPPADLTRLQAMQYRDIAGWLPSDLLLKLDRCLMAHGLEGRTPFLDPEVARFAFHLPDAMKLHGRLGKWLLRRWLQRHCPAAEPFARKAGFTTPVASWIAPRAALLGPRIAEVEGVRRLCDPEAARAVFKDQRHAAHRWPLLFLAVWWGIHAERLAPAEALARLER